MNLKQNLKSIGINVVTMALACAIGMPLGNMIMRQFKPVNAPPTPIALASDTANLVFKDTSKDLILFATTTCSFCKAGVQFLEKSGANYQIYYIDKDAQAKKTYELLKIEGVPVLLSKQQYILGFREEVWGLFINKGHSKLFAAIPKGL